MSFKQITSSVDIGNRALAMVSESKIISSIDDPGINAQAIRRWYKPVIARLLEMHHWGLATQHDTMAQVTNTRGNEWLYAFQPPEDMAFPVGISLANGVSSMSYYRGLTGLLGLMNGKPIFQLHNGVMFANITGDLEYVSFNITEASFTATFENIVVLMLASRLALELPKDFELSEKLAEQAKTEINVAMAQNLNVGGHKYGAIVSETELVRGSIYDRSWDYLPGGFGGV